MPKDIEQDPEKNNDADLDESGEDSEDRGNSRDRPLSPRQLVLQQMEERLAEERGEQLEPAATAGSKAKAGSGEVAEEATPTSEHSAQDPLADLIEEKDGKPGMTLDVNGRKEWYPLENIRAAAMRSNAADERFNQAAELRRQAAADLKAAESLKTAAPIATRSTPDVSVDEKTLDQVSLDLAKSLLDDTPEVIATKLKTVLTTTLQARAPSVDQNVVADLAAKQVTAKLSEKDRQQDLLDGLNKFHEQFPEMKVGSPLYAVADSMSDSVAAEHPDWAPSRVMLEAGRRAQAWHDTLKGAPVAPETREQPAPKTTSNREARKGNLVPMPKARTGTPQQSETLEESSPAAFMASLRKARGQPALVA